MSKNLRGLSERKGLEENLFNEITNASELHSPGRIERIRDIASESLTGEAHVYGVSTFYDFLKESHINKKIFICDGTACLTSGKQDELKTALNKYFDSSEVGSVTCLGHCHRNKSFMFNGRTYSINDISELDQIFDKYTRNIKPVNTYTALKNPILLEESGDLINFSPLVSSKTIGLWNAARTSMHPDIIKSYVFELNKEIEKYGVIVHYSWFDIAKKIKSYKDYWAYHWRAIYGLDTEDTAENNVMFNKPWSEVSDEDIKCLATKLEKEKGGWFFHNPVDWAAKTCWIDKEDLNEID